MAQKEKPVSIEYREVGVISFSSTRERLLCTLLNLAKLA